MTHKDIFEEAFPQYTQIGGNHYTKFPIQPYEFISKNDLSFFQGNVIKYVCRYQRKGGAEDISWEIFPEDYHSALYAFSNKEKLNKLIRKKYLYEPKANI